MTDEPHVFTAPTGPGLWSGWCSLHGPLMTMWTDERFAALDAIGHAAAHHQRLDTGQHTV